MSLDPQDLVEEFRQALGGAPTIRAEPQGEVRAHERPALLSSLLQGMDAAVRQRCGEGARIEVSAPRAQGPDAVALSARFTKPGRAPLDLDFAMHGAFVATTGLDPRDDHDVVNPARQSVYRNAQFGMLLNQVKDVALLYFRDRKP